MDFSDVRGQEAVKRAMTIALAGGHPIVLYGPSGNGKTMLIEAAKKIRESNDFRGQGVVTYEVTVDRRPHPDAPDPKLVAAGFGKVSDIHVEVPPVPFRELTGKRLGTNSATVLRQVAGAAKHSSLELTDSCLLLGRQAFDELGLNPRSWAAIVRVSRTIANLDGSERIAENHLAEAVQYRMLDRLVRL